MKKVFATMFAAVALLASATGASAKTFQSSQTGLNANLPDDMTVVADEESATVGQTADQNLVFSFHPMLTEGIDEDAIGQMLTTVAAQADLSLDQMKKDDFKTKTLEGGLIYGTNADGVNLIIGLCGMPDNEAVAFLFTVTFDDSRAEDVQAILDSLEVKF